MIKKMMWALPMVALMIACGGGETKQEEKAPAVAEVKEDLSANPDYKKGLALVVQADCLTCHKVNETSTGPAYADIANKYAGADDAMIDKLAKTIIAGGSGNWGAVPMTAHPDVTEEDARQMVKYVLLLKK